MADTFRRASLDGWRLRIAGALNYRDAAAEVQTLREIGGAAVEVRGNPTRREVEELYRASPVYWHFAGYGSPSDSVHNEHFGMSVVEAMSARSVPLAYASAGPSEILAGIDFCLWNSLDEVIEKTHELASNERLRRELAAVCYRRALDFGFERFERDVVTRVRALMRGH
jgi:glycosyltransferase involved in cell wall biosynthesis